MIIFHLPSINPPAWPPAHLRVWLAAVLAGWLERALPVFCRPPSARQLGPPALLQTPAAPPAATTIFPELFPSSAWLPCRRADTRPRARRTGRRSFPAPNAPCSPRRENSFRDSA